jgi:hypothetical protein
LAADVSQPAGSPPTAESTPAVPQYRPPRKRYEARFLAVYGVLALVLAGAIAGFVVLVAKPNHHTTSIWSTWQPKSSDPETMLKEIADFVGKEYRLTKGGGQLVGVVASRPAVQNIEIKAIAVRSAPGSNSNISILGADKTEMFILCGLGSQCSISKGKPTTARGRVLRRESLELALYTFKYVPGIDSIVAFLPPKPGSNPTYTLFLRKTDLSKELKQPLHRTLTRLSAPTPTTTDPKETPVIDRLTLPSLFQYSLTQSQDGSAILVLDPLALNG